MKTPIELFKAFSSIPHCSYKAEKMKEYLIAFGKECGYDIQVDAIGNILCSKGSPKCCLQAHYDMVCIGSAEQGVTVLEKDGWLVADNSSLGADNGIGMACMMALMQTETDLECLFTSEEEVGLVGATNLELTIQSKYLINLDTEDEGDVSIGCAGGYELHARLPLEFSSQSASRQTYLLESHGYEGGHSGMDIDSGIRNAIKDMGFLLQKHQCGLLTLSGGEKKNSIPKGARAEIVACSDFKIGHPRFSLTESGMSSKPLITNSDAVIRLINSLASGVLDYDRNLRVVSNSINLSTIDMQDDSLHLALMGRSNTNSELDNNIVQTSAILEANGCLDLEIKERYPAWDPIESPFAHMTRDLYRKTMPDSDFKMIHAGFECGVLKNKFPDVDMVSIGPNIHNPHSNSERTEIASVNRVFDLLKEIIKSL